MKHKNSLGCSQAGRVMPYVMLGKAGVYIHSLQSSGLGYAFGSCNMEGFFLFCYLLKMLKQPIYGEETEREWRTVAEREREYDQICVLENTRNILCVS